MMRCTKNPRVCLMKHPYENDGFNVCPANESDCGASFPGQIV